LETELKLLKKKECGWFGHVDVFEHGSLNCVHMIPAKEFSNMEFEVQFPPKIKTNVRVSTINHDSILNDIPPEAKSCLVYNHNDLYEHCPDPPVYPIPVDFRRYRELRSLQAVFKTIPSATKICIFSHMLVSPVDVETVLGEEFIQCMREVQKDVPSPRYSSLTDL